MKDFIYHAPTEVVFGKESEEQVARLVKKYGGHKVLVHYGGSSAKRSGLLDKICGLLQEGGLDIVLLGGVVPNPRLSKVHEGIVLCREEKVDFILSVGGGSVIDSAKAIAYGVPYDGEVWDFYLGKDDARECLPTGCVLTIPAAGSEMSEASVITNEDGDVKIGYSNQISRPKFAIMNPERTFTLPPYQTAAGVTDMMMHTMERYFSKDDDMEITDAIAEAVLRTCMKEGRKALDNPTDYKSRANVMWAGTLAHNDLTGCGTTGDWATHCIEHELSGMFDVSHGAGLAVMWGSWARYTREENMPRFARFAHNVMGIETKGMSDLDAAEAGIQAMEKFFNSSGLPTNIHTLIGKEISEAEIEEMADKCTNGDTITVGGLKVLKKADVIKIYQMAK